MDIDVKKLSDNEIRILCDQLAREKVSREMVNVKKCDLYMSKEQAEKWYHFIVGDSEDGFSDPYFWINPAMKSICDALTGNYKVVTNKYGNKVVHRISGDFLNNAKDYIELYNELVKVVDTFVDKKTNEEEK